MGALHALELLGQASPSVSSSPSTAPLVTHAPDSQTPDEMHAPAVQSITAKY